MTRVRDTAVGLVAVYGGLSLAVGVLAFLGARWAHTYFITAATGDAVAELGPAFVNTVLLQLGVTVLALTPVMSTLAGVLVGRGIFQPVRSIQVAAVGGFVGTLVFGLVVAALGSLGTAAGSLWTTSYLSVLVAAAVLAALTGGIGAAVGGRLD